MTDADAGNQVDERPADAPTTELSGLRELVQLTVESRAHGWRLDHYLNRLFPNHSRAALQRAISSGHVTLHGLATALTRKLDGKLAALAPDLSVYGFTFDSANVCQLDGEGGSLAAHVTYVNTSYGTRFSIFSLPRWNGINDGEGGSEPTIESPFVQTHDQCSQMTVLGWHADETTYVCCGSIDQGILRAMVLEVGADVEQVDP